MELKKPEKRSVVQDVIGLEVVNGWPCFIIRLRPVLWDWFWLTTA